MRGWMLAALALALPGLAQAQDFTTHTRYDAAGRVTGTVSADPDGGGPLPRLATRNIYDAAGRLVRVEKGRIGGVPAPGDWSGFVADEAVDTAYDALDRKLRETRTGVDPQSGQWVTTGVSDFSYNDQGLPDCTAVRMTPGSFGGGPIAACDQTAGGIDRITRNLYDAAGQLLTVQRGVGTNLAQSYASYTYSPTGKRLSVTDANGNRATMAYDGHDRQSHWYFPHPTATGQTSTADYEAYSYDANGNRLTLRKRDGRTIAYAYDALDRMVSKTYPNGGARPVYYAYDLRGLQTAARFDSLSGEGVTNGYDGFGRATSTTLTMDGISRTLTRGFDANGNRIWLQHADGVGFAADFDGLDRWFHIPAVTWVGFDGQGRPSIEHRGNPTQSTMSYDAAGRLVSRNHDLGGTSADHSVSLSYNPAGQIVGRWRGNDAYAFNELPNVNRAYTVNGLNQYTSVPGLISFTYDANGNLTGDGSVGYGYDIENRLVSVWGAKTATLRYDPLGRLYELSGPISGVLRFLWDGDELVAEYDTLGNLLRRYVHRGTAGADDPLVWYDGAGLGDPRALYTDHQGSVIAVGNAAGAAIAINRYDDWGIPASTNMGRFGYTGQTWIPDIGLWHYKARFYSPTLGRFLQTDPIGYEDDVNLYAYVGNDPVNQVDPTGLCAGPAIIPCAMVVAEAAPGLMTAATATVTLVTAAITSMMSSDGGDKKFVVPDRQSGDANNGGPGRQNQRAGVAGQKRELSKDRRNRQREESRAEKHGDKQYKEPASEQYAKWRAKEAERAGGKDARREGHDAKRRGEGDRTKEQIDEDYRKK